MIVRTKAEIYVERLNCDSCGVEMKSTEEILPFNHPLFPHVSKLCGHSENVESQQFPRTIY